MQECVHSEQNDSPLLKRFAQFRGPGIPGPLMPESAQPVVHIRSRLSLAESADAPRVV